MTGLVTPVYSAVGMDLEVEADAHPAVQSASAATRVHQVILQPNSRGANQLSYKREQESNIHSSPKQLSHSLFSFLFSLSAPVKSCPAFCPSFLPQSSGG